MITIEQKFSLTIRFTLKGKHRIALSNFLKKYPRATYPDILDWAAERGVDMSDWTEEELTETEESMTTERNWGFPALKVWKDKELIHVR
jgi:hypothetical protein